MRVSMCGIVCDVYFLSNVVHHSRHWVVIVVREYTFGVSVLLGPKLARSEQTRETLWYA